MFAEWIAKGKPSVLGIASGAVAGLVAITPASGFVGPSAGVIIGLAAGIVCYFSATSLKRALKYDDSLDAFGVHGVGGILGAVLTGVFFSKELSGIDVPVATQVLTQLKGVLTTVVYGFTVSYVLLILIDKTVGLRVSEEQEREGLDISLHGESIE
jgi:Amt family ammonium transporter